MFRTLKINPCSSNHLKISHKHIKNLQLLWGPHISTNKLF